MAALIVIDDPSNPPTTGSVDRDVTFLGVQFDLSNFDDTGVLVWRWELTDKPIGSTASLSSTTTATTDITPDVEGTYLVRLKTYTDAGATVLEGLDHQGIGVRFAVGAGGFDWRVPGAGETTQFDASRGWATAREEMIRDVRAAIVVLDLQAAYGNGELITTDAQGAVDLVRGVGTVAGEGALSVSDANVVPSRTAALLALADANVGSADAFLASRSVAGGAAGRFERAVGTERAVEVGVDTPTETGVWFADGDMVLGAAAMSGTELFRVVGDARVEGQIVKPTAVSMTEQASVGNPGAGQGTLWVQDTTPTSLIFKDDTGADVVVVGGGSLSHTLQQAYDDGKTISTTSGQGNVVINHGGTTSQRALSVKHTSLAARSVSLIDINDQGTGPGTALKLINNAGTVTSAATQVPSAVERWTARTWTGAAEAERDFDAYAAIASTSVDEDLAGTPTTIAQYRIDYEGQPLLIVHAGEPVPGSPPATIFRHKAVNASDNGFEFVFENDMASDDNLLTIRDNAGETGAGTTKLAVLGSGQVFFRDDSLTTPSLTFIGDSATGFGRHGASRAGIWANTKIVFVVDGAATPTFGEFQESDTAVSNAAQFDSHQLRLTESGWDGAEALRSYAIYAEAPADGSDESDTNRSRIAVDIIGTNTNRLLEIVPGVADPAVSTPPGVIFRNSSPGGGPSAFSFVASTQHAFDETVFEVRDNDAAPGSFLFRVQGTGNFSVFSSYTTLLAAQANSPRLNRSGDGDTGPGFPANDIFSMVAGGLDAFEVAHAVGNNPTTAIVRSDGADAVGSDLQLYQDSTSPLAGDVVGFLSYYGEDSADNKELYSQIRGVLVDPTTTDEDGGLWFDVVSAGALHNANEEDYPWRLTSNHLSTAPGGGVGMVVGTKLHANAGVDDGEYKRTNRVATTGNTPTLLDSFTLPTERNYWVRAMVVAYGQDTTARGQAIWQLIGMVWRTASGNAVLSADGVSSTTRDDGQADGAAWSATLVVSGDDVQVQVTGAASTNIEWACYVEYQGVTNPVFP